jgi:hypothetical protein
VKAHGAMSAMPLSAILEYVTAARVRRTGPDPRRQPSGGERCYAYVRAAGVPEYSQGTHNADYGFL